MKFPTEKHLKELGKDRFGYNLLSKKILDEILIEMELPNSFGFYGNWGSGKSTMLDFIQQHIKNRQIKEYKNITSVYFESWRYEYSDQSDLLFALLNCIKKQTGITDTKWKQLLVDAAVISSGLARTIGGLNAGEVMDDFEKFEGKIFKEHERWVDKIESFKEDFENIVKNVLKKKRTEKIFIFIDDLDRCLPENAVKLLEGIKNFLSISNTLFVLAIDRRIVSEMIEKKYGLHFGYGDEYLMKIIHYYYELPSVELKDIVSEILAIYDIESTERQKSYIVHFLENEAKEPRLAKHVLHQLGMRIKISKNITDLLSKDAAEETLQYVFIASFLLTKFSNLFSSGDPSRLLKNIRDSAATILKGNTRDDEYRTTTEAYNINPETRNKIETIMMRYPISSVKKAEPDRLINDTNRLSMIMKGLRSYN